MAIEFNSADESLVKFNTAFGVDSQIAACCFYAEVKLPQAADGVRQNVFSSGHPNPDASVPIRYTLFISHLRQPGFQVVNSTSIAETLDLDTWYAVFMNWIPNVPAISAAFIPLAEEIPMQNNFSSLERGSPSGLHHIGARLNGSFAYSNITLAKCGMWTGGFNFSDLHEIAQTIDTYRPDDCFFFDTLKPLDKSVGDGLKDHWWASQRGSIVMSGVNSGTINDTPRVAEEPNYYWMRRKRSLFIGENPLFVTPQVF